MKITVRVIIIIKPAHHVLVGFLQSSSAIKLQNHPSTVNKLWIIASAARRIGRMCEVAEWLAQGDEAGNCR